MAKSKKMNKTKLFRLIVLAIFVLITLVSTLLLSRWVLSLREPDKLAWFQSAIDSLGIRGWFVLLLLQYVQIVIAFVPGGPIQIVAGALYGPWGGLAICVVGTILASSSVFWLVSHYGHRIIALFVDEESILKYKFLKDSKRLELLVLILFFIPGTPKDALTYLFALTPIPMSRFMFIATLARLPAMVTSVMAGGYIISGNWLRAGVLFCAITLISLAGLLLRQKIMTLYSSNEK